MSEGIPYGDIIVLGAIAAFIILRFRSILGEKSGFDVTQTPKPKVEKEKEKEERIVQLHPASREMQPEPKEQKDTAFEEIELVTLKEDLSQIKEADQSFTVDSFLKGASMAFEMVLGAFHKGEAETLKMLMAKPLYEEFSLAIKDRSEEDSVTLVSISESEITDAQLEGTLAQVTVRFVSEQIIAPHKHVQEIEDEWVFERDTRSKNPNWTIIDT